ncbi:MAG TPA: DEAD/DEAH box helicase, partial [Spirochaetia bacterium]|nr:DEAD/DEAH box helicase [Spirochaetia bacterium]
MILNRTDPREAGAMDKGLSEIFHPLLAQWFSGRYSSPTEAQKGAWPVIAAGRHLLLSAPTGTGKTYSAFLYAINQLLTGAWEAGRVRVLYISPLKALNSDIRVNLLSPLAQISALFRARGLSVPAIQVQTRSGDTPESERRRMLRHPPEILITTPESLNLILSSPNAWGLLTGIQTVIIDEIHSVLESKRGTHLITAIERLVPLSGEFQRIGLSATIRPMELAAAFLGGYVGRQTGAGWTYEPR